MPPTLHCRIFHAFIQTHRHRQRRHSRHCHRHCYRHRRRHRRRLHDFDDVFLLLIIMLLVLEMTRYGVLQNAFSTNDAWPMKE